MNIKTKIQCLVLLSIFVAGYYGFCNYSSSQQTARQMQKVEDYVQLSVCISNLVHETQKERGMTSGYLATGGKSFSKQLPVQQKATENASKKLEEFLDGFDLEENGEINRHFQKGRETYREIRTLRKDVLKLQTPKDKNVVSLYTHHNSQMLNTISLITQSAKDQTLSGRIQSYSGFLRIKENSGIERAVTAAVFANDQLTKERFQNISGLIRIQESYLRDYLLSATKKQKEAITSLQEKACSIAVRNYRSLILDGAKNTDFGVSTEKWFNAKTECINRMKKIEDQLSKELIDMAYQKRTEANQAFWMSCGVTISLMIIMFGLGTGINRSILRSLDRFRLALKDIAEGDGNLTKRLAITNDEFGEVATYFNQFAERIQNFVKKVKVNSMDLSSSANQMNRMSDELSNGATETKENTASIVGSSESLSSKMEGLSKVCRTVSSQSSDVSERVESIEETLREISKSTEDSVRHSDEVVSLVEASSKKTETLNEVARDIGRMVEVIEDIAEQTNLLALNATIEASRAGESGHGFAVVATEVKELAFKTSKATEEIRHQVDSIQQSTEVSLDSVKQIRSAIGSVSRSAGKIAESVDSQLEETKDIVDVAKSTATSITSLNKSLSQSAVVSRGISSSIHKVDDVAQKTDGVATEAEESSDNVDTLARELFGLVNEFVVD